jgi:CHAT domain-containing protein/tetratricopeptide (TPR) repeat protein
LETSLDERRHRFLRILLVLLFMLLCSFVAVPSPATKRPSWPVVLEEQFESPQTSWPRYGDPNLTMNTSNGKLAISFKSADTMAELSLPSNKSYLDFALQVCIEFTSGFGEAGVMFRRSDPNNYLLFSVSTSGYYQIARIQAGHYWPLVEQKLYPGFDASITISFEIVGQGSNLQFYADGKMFCHLSEDHLRSGSISLYATSLASGMFIVGFDNIALRVDQDLQSAAGTANSLLSLSEIRMQEHNFADAIACLREARSIIADKLSWPKQLAETDVRLARAYAVLHSYLLALSCYEKALPTARHILDRRMEADILREMGEVYTATGDPGNALGTLNQALSLYKERDETDMVSLVLSDIGGVYLSLGDYEKARNTYMEAKRTAEGITDLSHIGTAILGLAMCGANTGNYNESISLFETAISIFRTAKDTANCSYACLLLGEFELGLGLPERAKEKFSAAFDLAQTTGDWQTRANALLGMGRSSLLTFSLSKSLEFFQEALDEFRNGNAREDEARAMIDIAQYYIVISEYDSALDVLTEALPVLSETGNTHDHIQCQVAISYCWWLLGEYDRGSSALGHAMQSANALGLLPEQAMALALQGVYEISLQRLSAARDTYNQALVLFQKLHDPRGVAAVSNNLGLVLASMRKYDLALTHYEKALDFYHTNTYPVMEAHTLLNLGNAMTGMGKYAQGIEYFEGALSLFRRLDDVEGTGATLIDLAYVYGLLHSYDHATSLLHECLDLLNRSGSVYIDFIWRAYASLGTVAIQRGDTDTAIEAWSHAISSVEKARAVLTRTNSKLVFMRDKSALYNSLVLLLVSQDSLSSSLFYTEHAKARVLVDMMETAIVCHGERMSGKLEKASTSLRALNAQVEKTQGSALGSNILSDFVTSYPQSSSASEWATLAHVRRSSEQDYSAIVSGLESQYPALGDTLSISGIRLQQYFQYVQSELGKSTVTLEYFVTDKETIVWVITQEGIQTASRIPITREELTEQVRAFREEIENPPVLGQEAVSYLNALEKGRDLYQLLIAPVEECLQGAKHLVIIPSDVLFYLPFGALYVCPECEGNDLYGGKFLIEDYSISYAPSMASLYWPLQHAGDGAYDSVLAVGNPTGNLPAAEQEAIAIAASFQQSKLLLGAAGTEAALKGALKTQDYDVVHLATHGAFDRVLPLLSHLAFCESEDEDGALYAGEILGLSLTSNLVVLSACQTALPPQLTEETQELVLGDELQGLSQALFVAGTPSAILTLWNVNDVSTSHLMQTMYQRLQNAVETGEALRQAQLFLLHDLAYRHPYFWAPFVLYGDWS